MSCEGHAGRFVQQGGSRAWGDGRGCLQPWVVGRTVRNSTVVVTSVRPDGASRWTLAESQWIKSHEKMHPAWFACESAVRTQIRSGVAL